MKMIEDLEITKSNFIHILKNRGKHVSSEMDDDALVKKVEYLKKQELAHLATIRGLVFDESSLESIIDVLFKDVHKKIHAKLIEDLHKHYHKKKQINLLYDFHIFHHKQKAKNIKEEIHRNLQKRQNIHINKGIKKFNRLKKIIILLIKRIYLKKN